MLRIVVSIVSIIMIVLIIVSIQKYNAKTPSKCPCANKSYQSNQIVQPKYISNNTSP